MPDSSVGSLLPFAWSDEPSAARYGEGVSRPKFGERTREYRLRITSPNFPPMLWITKAETKKHAIKYAQARWPECKVEVQK